MQSKCNDETKSSWKSQSQPHRVDLAQPGNKPLWPSFLNHHHTQSPRCRLPSAHAHRHDYIQKRLIGLQNTRAELINEFKINLIGIQRLQGIH